MKKRKKRRKGINGKAKGASFERHIAKMILGAASGTGFEFEGKDCYRTPASGGHPFAKDEHPSDLALTRRILKVLPFTIECKNTKQARLHHFVRRVDRHEKSWMEKQAIDQVLKANEKTAHKRYPMVVFKEDRGEIFAITTLPAISRVIPDSPYIEWGLKFKYENDVWIICYFKEFLKYWRRQLKQLKKDEVK